MAVDGCHRTSARGWIYMHQQDDDAVTRHPRSALHQEAVKGVVRRHITSHYLPARHKGKDFTVSW